MKNNDKNVTWLSNCALSVLVISLAFLCAFPSNPVLETDGEGAGIYRNGKAEKNAVSLTINVYWGTEEVYSILDILHTYQAKATFFVGGCWADDNVDCLRAIYNQGHEIGNHGYFHKDHKQLNERENENEISSCNRFIQLAIGYAPTLFAPPSGAYGNNMLTVCQQLNMQTILWSKDTIDWRDKDEQLVYTRATKNVKAGDFILMHPMSHTVKALPKILTHYQNLGLQVITVSQHLQ